MINLTVLNFKDILKYLVRITIIIGIVIGTARYFSHIDVKNQETQVKQSIDSKIKKITSASFTSCIDNVLSVAKEVNEPLREEKKKAEEEQNKENKLSTSRSLSPLERILNYELGMTSSITDGTLNNVANIKPEDLSGEDKEEIVQTNVPTEVISDNNISASFSSEYESVKVKNQSDFEITQEMLTPDMELDNKKDVMIFHTHTCESYTPSEKYNYEMTGNYRTTDLNYSVAKVGSTLQEYLKGYGYNVIHDTTYHDYPAYTGSYDRSLTTVQNLLESNQGVQTVIDLHRDAVGNGTDYGPTVKIGEEVAAQLMFVIGTNGGGLWHPNWQQNLKFAVKIQQKANEMYPGLFRPITLRNSRYNQQVSKAACIIEVGATANTMEQCMVSMKYLAKVMSEVIK